MNRGQSPILFLAALVLAAPAQARVIDVHSEIRIAKSGELTVTERITVEGTAVVFQRELPPEASIADVIRDGHPESHDLDGMRLRVGGGAVPDGRHLYQVTYHAARRIAFLSDHDALHWTLKGAERMTAEVILPSSVPARQIKVEARGQSFVRDGRAAFRSERETDIVVRFPKGVVVEPGIGQRAHWFFSDYFGAVLLGALLVLAAGVLYLIRGQGRNT